MHLSRLGQVVLFCEKHSLKPYRVMKNAIANGFDLISEIRIAGKLAFKVANRLD